MARESEQTATVEAGREAVREAGSRRKEEVASRPKVRNLPPFKVILHNDDRNEMVYVVKVIRDLTPLGRIEAVRKMLEAHLRGCAVLLVTHQERAELYVEQFSSCRLKATAEADG